MTDAPRLTPPGGDRPSTADTGSRSQLWLMLGLVVALLLGLAVILVLPGLAEREPKTAEQPTPRPAEPAATVPNPGKQDAAKAALSEVLQRRAALETDGVEIWGGEDFGRLLEQVGSADEALDRGRFAEGAELYRQVLEGFDRLEQSRDARFDAALAAGMQALEEADGDAAAKQFRIALALRPDDENVRKGLERAGTIERVTELTREGETLEQQDRLDDARKAYAEAAALDAFYQPAQHGLQRITELIRQREFRAAMSDVLNALEAGSFGRAEKALARARTLDPQAPELQEISAQLSTARRNTSLRTLRKRAIRAEADEDWQTAVRLHRQALKLDPAATFAESGLEQAEARLELMGKMEHYLSQPERLQAKQALNNAEALLEVAYAVTDAGPKLQAARDKLASLVTWAQTPVPVRLRSDNATEVVIYQVGRFGRFRQRDLRLRPGTYTAVGSRDGYRDVRKVFRVDTTQPVTDLVIRCEERI